MQIETAKKYLYFKKLKKDIMKMLLKLQRQQDLFAMSDRSLN